MVDLVFKKMEGLVPAIAQDAVTHEVLMLGFMDQAAWEKTLETGKATYFSRTTQKLWTKGETSGHYQIVREIRIDCDNDTVLLKVEQLGGGACHTGYRSCFYRVLDGDSLRIDGSPAFNPREVYQ
ncbi:MAG: phosphoribosyl-AMP cyclohydrolase [Deltaproteobacteria bacterium]|nr:MAG: phosphoribosyl-AMP cyclohydrolase [Deltaproteobacteria bacterium]